MSKLTDEDVERIAKRVAELVAAKTVINLPPVPYVRPYYGPHYNPGTFSAPAAAYTIWNGPITYV
jgi:hypothetical protein